MNTLNGVVVNTGPDSSPALILALQLLQQLTTNDHGKTSPPVVSWGNTSLVDLSPFDPSLATASPDQITAMLTMIGQVVWRYAPLLLAELPEAALLDSHKARNAYRVQHQLPENVATNVPYAALRPLLSTAAQRRRLRPSTDQVEGQRWNSLAFPQAAQRIRVFNSNKRNLTDYTVLPQRATTFKTPALAYSVNRARIRKSANVDATVERYMVINDMRRIIGAKPRVLKLNDASQHPACVRDMEPIRGYNAPVAAMDVIGVMTRMGQRAPYKYDQCQDENIFLQDGSLRTGVFFSTNGVTASLEPLDGDLFGYVDIDKRPFEIVLNSRMAYPRVQISFAHEYLHMISELHKFNLTHEQIHELALTLVEEVLPGLSSLAEFTNNAQP